MRESKICEGIPLLKMNSFLSYIFPVLEFLNFTFFGYLGVEFLISSFVQIDMCTFNKQQVPFDRFRGKNWAEHFKPFI